MIDKTIELTKKYDRSVILVISAIGTALIVYIAFGSNINTVVEQTPIIQELKTKFKVQDEKNRVFDEKLTDIGRDIKQILREMPRR